MMELLWTPEAIEDRKYIYDYIEADNPFAALALDDRIAEKIGALGEYPKMGRPGKVLNTLELVIHSSYMVIYDVMETRVRILNVVHTVRQWPPLRDE